MQAKIECDWFKPSKHEVIHYMFLYIFYIFLYFHILFVITNWDFYCMVSDYKKYIIYQIIISYGGGGGGSCASSRRTRCKLFVSVANFYTKA